MAVVTTATVTEPACFQTHMHFYMAGIDQQVGAVPSISVDSSRWYTTCFTWENTEGRWRGYLDGEEITSNKTGTGAIQTHTSCHQHSHFIRQRYIC